MAYSTKKSFALLFSVELWERWAFYGMQALLVLYFIHKIGFPDIEAYAIFGAFVALMYILPSFGGIIADKFIGPRATLAVGAAILVIGYAGLCFNLSNKIFMPLALIAVGGGIFKPNPSRLIERIYQAEQNKLSSAFTIFYMAVNIGSLLSMAITPIVAKYYGYNTAFGISFIGMMLALLNYLIMYNRLKHLTVKIAKPFNFKRLFMLIILIIVSIIASFFLIEHYEATSYVILSGGIVILFYAISAGSKYDKIQQKRLLVAAILICQAIIFCIIYLQMPTTMTLFADRNSSNILLGFSISPATYQLLNPFWIVVLGPILAKAYQFSNFSMPVKFSVGTLLCGLGIMILPIAAYFSHHGIINGNWFILAYFLQSIGELLVSALGLAMIASYIPKDMMGFAMGGWFMCLSVAAILAGKIAAIANIPKNLTDPMKSLPIYTHYFWIISIITIIIGFIFLLLTPMLKKLAEEK